ncbi:MAG: ABC transporter ATP-binding protein [Treponema sp.]|nr:ABC transporter ATP-binding protein [Treponema sp.]
MTLTGVTKKLGDFFLNIEELAIPGPGIYGLVGPNGSGKSTLAKLMAGLLDPDSGSIDVEGLTSREITFIAHKPYMMDDTVYNNLVYPLKLRKTNPDPHLVQDLLEKMGFTKREKQKARSLSGGEQQKLALLRALIFKPRLIIADEAMTALDIDSLDLFEKMILDEQKKDPIIWIIISHQMSQIRRLVNHVYFMHNGKIETDGATEDLFTVNSNPYLKQYLRAYGDGISKSGEHQ